MQHLSRAIETGLDLYSRARDVPGDVARGIRNAVVAAKDAGMRAQQDARSLMPAAVDVQAERAMEIAANSRGVFTDQLTPLNGNPQGVHALPANERLFQLQQAARDGALDLERYPQGGPAQGPAAPLRDQRGGVHPGQVQAMVEAGLAPPPRAIPADPWTNAGVADLRLPGDGWSPPPARTLQPDGSGITATADRATPLASMTAPGPGGVSAPVVHPAGGTAEVMPVSPVAASVPAEPLVETPPLPLSAATSPALAVATESAMRLSERPATVAPAEAPAVTLARPPVAPPAPHPGAAAPAATTATPAASSGSAAAPVATPAASSDPRRPKRTESAAFAMERERARRQRKPPEASGPRAADGTPSSDGDGWGADAVGYLGLAAGSVGGGLALSQLFNRPSQPQGQPGQQPPFA